MAASKNVRLPLLVLFLICLLILLSASGCSRGAQAAYGSSGEGGSSDHHVSLLPISMTLFPTSSENCRYGGAITSKAAIPWLETVNVGHFIKFGNASSSFAYPESIEAIRLVRTKQDFTIVDNNWRFLPTYQIIPPLTMEPDGLGPLVMANPGALWLIGNEMDVPNLKQDHSTPQMYAEMYHDAYYFIKNLDPYAHVAVGGLSMMTPARLSYWDIVWSTYRSKYNETMPVDVWNSHLYILSEIRPWDQKGADGQLAIGTDPDLAKRAPSGYPEEECPKEDVYCRAEHDDIDIFAAQITAMRTWMKDHGQQNKPLIITEFSQLYPYAFNDPEDADKCSLQDEFGRCFTPARVTAFMRKAVDFLETAKDPKLGLAADDYRLVQHWTWYSLRANKNWSGGSSSLLRPVYEDEEPGTLSALTAMGLTYRSMIGDSDLTYNLVAGEAIDVSAKAAKGTAVIPLKVGFYNNGNSAISRSFKVAFYADAALSDKIDEVVVNPAYTGLINGCSWGRIADWVSVEWPDVPAQGVHRYWAIVDSGNWIRGETNESDNVISGRITFKN